ncbi:MAG: hypothetical protein QF441_06105 [Bacteriovoracaceae bacterium]|jgi:hypothetical protein|nr:hypothetical protein [Halobacteriovoraceae bacterium]MDP7320162.1 hypothetical protein [Bacteriovoracaceae bacterium]|tara:strand:- start:693 stop:1223 length:531 start_codon:yes stop_codon:yes gene_type:complete
MLKLTVLVGLNFIISTVCFATNYQCTSFSLNSSDPIKQQKTLNIHLNSQLNQAILIKDEKTLYKNMTTNSHSLHILSDNSSALPIHYRLYNNQAAMQVINEYIQALALEYSLNLADQNILKNEIVQVFGEIKLNGIKYTGKKISAFLSCDQINSQSPYYGEDNRKNSNSQSEARVL